jgi:Flp pilus assembly protein TadD
MSGDIRGGLEDLSDAIRLQPGSSLYLSRAAVHGMAGDFEGAIADCTEALRLKPDDFEAYARRGMARMERKDAAGAAQDFEKALELAPPGWPQHARIDQLLRGLRPK